jgi:carbamoyl-phosphate synthase large subunit
MKGKKLKKVLIIGAGTMQIPVIEKCKELGYESIATDADKNAPGMQIADIALEINTLDKTATLDAAKKYKIDGIITTSDYPVRTVAYVCEQLGLKGLSEDAAKTCTNKYLLRENLSKHNIICPKYWKIKDLHEVTLIEKKLLYPLIVKPVDSSASRGVSKVSNYNQLETAVKEALVYSKSGDVIIEEFLEGPEYSVESLTQNGKTIVIAITEKTTDSSSSYFVEVRHIIPANITSREEKEVKSLVKKVIKSIGLNNCGTHTELKLTSKGPIIIEIGARLGGDYITSDLVPLSTDVNMLENIINISIGHKINTKITKRNYAGVQFVNSENYDSVKRHLEEISLKSGFVRSELKEYKKVELKSSLDRLGYYICTAKTRKKLLDLLNYKRNNL